MCKTKLIILFIICLFLLAAAAANADAAAAAPTAADTNTNTNPDPDPDPDTNADADADADADAGRAADADLNGRIDNIIGAALAWLDEAGTSGFGAASAWLDEAGMSGIGAASAWLPTLCFSPNQHPAWLWDVYRWEPPRLLKEKDIEIINKMISFVLHMHYLSQRSAIHNIRVRERVYVNVFLSFPFPFFFCGFAPKVIGMCGNGTGGVAGGGARNFFFSIRNASFSFLSTAE
jgi:hypothetical protein